MRLLAVAAIACASARAEADPVLVLDRCTTLDPAALRAAIQRELAASRPDPRRDELTLDVACPDAVTARLSIELPPPALPLGRSLDLGEVPSELRLKLLAIAAVELIDGAIAARTPPPPPPPPTEGDPSLAGPARAPLPGERLPGMLAPPAAAEGRGPRAFAPERPREGVAAPAGARGARGALTPRAGVRLYPETPVPFVHLALEYELRWLSIGAAAAFGSAEVQLGSVSALLATLGVGTPPLCVGAATRACLRARAELGLARAKGRGVTPMIVARDARSPYAQLGLAIDAERTFGAFGALIAVEGAWAEGLIATSQAATALQLDGAVVTVLVGLRWRP
jgi:hypothetical protein